MNEAAAGGLRLRFRPIEQASGIGVDRALRPPPPFALTDSDDLVAAAAPACAPLSSRWPLPATMTMAYGPNGVPDTRCHDFYKDAHIHTHKGRKSHPFLGQDMCVRIHEGGFWTATDESKSKYTE